ncbi:G-patch domain-containing protein [Polychaeton citri CBS 116435]|uniref:PinX1-related protein 1 n=1 Tax=Polychaeton citri CBS 116435 TaxID=1314669 RepID=A0A9P4Q657_9PEZI|nr:G-patch domain-containing protein [Polychaeton citri CBS 116435]
MGLAGQKKKTKLSHDPNNTAWAKSTDTFGHKILTSQGWKPGEYLGARDAKHSEHYTAANASHIRVLLREDNAGIGAKVGRGNAETFGLSLFSSLLGRLNGKSEEEVQKQSDAQRDVELNLYTTRKYGFMNFVRGGLLVGNKIEEGKLEDYDKATKPSEAKVEQLAGKKRKATDTDDTKGQAWASKTEPKSKKSRREQNGSGKSTDEPGSEEAQNSKRRSKGVPQQEGSISGDEYPSPSDENTDRVASEKVKKSSWKSKQQGGEDDSTRRETKDEKRRRREERRLRKEERRRRKESKALGSAKASRSDSSTPLTETQFTDSAVTAVAPSATSSGTSTTLSFAGGRHAVRQRYIQQKRLASMNAQHLNEIFMLKSATG